MKLVEELEKKLSNLRKSAVGEILLGIIWFIIGILYYNNIINLNNLSLGIMGGVFIGASVILIVLGSTHFIKLRNIMKILEELKEEIT
ncbi:MAG: hypothetical protein BAJALOKI3v1_110080 [Promethearchaeota archaeon]|nr:MAG: hypothetical protein BAJALOKI3v1_110080 [Candidatus Lokiarchaeota archaeon]